MDARSTNPKVPIPRLRGAEPFKRQREPQQDRRNQHRAYVKNACENCRKHKTRCSGGLPRCRFCEERSLQCVYVEARRSRLREATKQNMQAIALLQDLRSRVDDEDKQRISAVLGGTADTVESTVSSVSERATARSGSPSEAYSGEAYASGSVGSNEDADHLDEDLFRNHESRATGYFGQNSEIQWLRNLKNQGASSVPNIRVADSTFYLDSDNLEPDIIVDAYELPPHDTAERLFNTYMSTVNGAFPIVPRVFQEQFHNLISALKQHRPYSTPDRWLAILNLILAIGARYSHMAQAEWRADDRDHLVYMTRAMRLLERTSSNSDIVSVPDLLLVQATGLRSLYYLVIGHVSKAWIMVGISIRYAIAVGMHVRNDDPSASLEKKDILVRTWWGLHSVECLLSSMTGRPCVLSDEHCTVPLPNPLPGESESLNPLLGKDNAGGMTSTFVAANPATAPLTTNLSHKNPTLPPFTSFLEARIRIGLITQRALSFLYSPGVATRSWEDVQKSIVALASQLDDWTLAAFPHGSIDYAITGPTTDSNTLRENILLRFQSYSTKILVSRPCLCRLDKRIKDQSTKSTNLNHGIAVSCVQAAQDLTQLLPDQPQPEWIYQNGPWWCIVHNIMQAATVFLLELVHGASTSSTSHDVSAPMKKLTRWLRVLRNRDAIAGRAYKIFFNLLHTYARRNRVDIADLLAEEEDESEGEDFIRASSTRSNPQFVAGPSNGQQQQDQSPLLGDLAIAHPYSNDSDFSFFQEQYSTLLPHGSPYTTQFDLNMDDIWEAQFDSRSPFEQQEQERERDQDEPPPG